MNILIISDIVGEYTFYEYRNRKLRLVLSKSNLNYKIEKYNTKEFWDELTELCNKDEDWNFDKREKAGRQILRRHFKSYDRVFCINKDDESFFEIFDFDVVKLPNERDTRFTYNYEEKTTEILQKELTKNNILTY